MTQATEKIRLQVMKSDADGIKEFCSDLSISRRGTAARIRTLRKQIEAVNYWGDKSDSEGGILPLIASYLAWNLIDLTSFWLNPIIAVTDKYKFAKGVGREVQSLFPKESTNQ